MKHMKWGGIVAVLGLMVWAAIVLGAGDPRIVKSHPGATPTPTPTPDMDVFAAATSAFDLSEYYQRFDNVLYYSECEDYEDLKIYYNLLDYNTYVKINRNGKDYLVIMASYSDYRTVATALNSITKRVSGKQLIIEADLDLTYKLEHGCAPWSSPMILIVENDGDYEYVTALGKGIEEFSGGYVRACGKVGLVDKDMNFMLPPVYDHIIPIYGDTYEPVDEWSIDLKRHPKYFYVRNEDGGALLDSNLERLPDRMYEEVFRDKRPW